MRHRTPLFVLALLLLPAAYGQGTPATRPPTTAQVMQFFEIMEVRQSTLKLLDTAQLQVKATMQEMLDRNFPEADSEVRNKIQANMAKSMDTFLKDYPIDEILRQMVPVYQSHYTEADFNALIAFYSSPTGQKVIRETPSVAAQAMQISMNAMKPKLDKMMSDLRAQIEAAAKEKQK